MSHCGELAAEQSVRPHQDIVCSGGKTCPGCVRQVSSGNRQTGNRKRNCAGCKQLHRLHSLSFFPTCFRDEGKDMFLLSYSTGMGSRSSETVRPPVDPIPSGRQAPVGEMRTVPQRCRTFYLRAEVPSFLQEMYRLSRRQASRGICQALQQ